MSNVLERKSLSKVNFEWLFQLIASLAWMISVFVYGSYELGDCLQLTAASAWFIANICSFISRK
ncbi:MAG: hypothetical protein MK193_12000 [Lentisphaeria bacterium]|nr:hypothetical protein [Lentisphaeria bacterium]